ncbi:MAG: hypothetical protein HUU29_01920 [Planctomycetaceae bacterium]|nr:hypothetical protein [Planctomycetaceae bacterium]
MARLPATTIVVLFFAACTSAPERMPDDEYRIVKDFEAARPGLLVRPSTPVANDELATLLAELDSDNVERFAAAKSRLRNGGEHVALRLATSPFPSTLRGKLAVIELVSLSPLSRERNPAEYAAYRDKLRDFVTIGGITDDDFGIHALKTLISLDDPADNDLIAGLVDNASRDIRWLAANHTLAARERITIGILERIVAMLGAEDMDMRSDGMHFLGRAWAMLTPGSNAAARMPEFDAAAAPDVRERQLGVWRAWRTEVAPDLMKQ